MKRLHAFRPPSPSCPQLMGRIVEQLFPTQEPMATSFEAGEPSCLDAPKALQRISDSSQKRPVRAKVRNTRSTPVSRGKQRQNPTDAVSLNKPNDSTRKEPAIVDRNTTNWIEVKGKKPRPKLKSRPDAIIVKCTEATPYAEVLKMMNADPSLQALKGNVQGTRKSAAGELILRMQKQDDPATNQLQLALKTVLSEKALVKTVHETIMIEVHNIDETTTADEVLMALFASFEGDIPSGVAPLMRKAYRGKQIASLVLQSSVATKLLGLKKVQIGWNQCKIHQRVEPTSCYIAPSLSLTEYCAVLDDIALDTQDKSPVIIAGDFNAWATDWGSSRTTPRGSILLDTFASLNVCLLNIGSKSTYSKAGRESIIDLTFASPEIARITRWFVADLYTHSDHMAVISEFTATRSGRNHSQPGRLGYKSESLNIGRFLSAIQGLRVGTDANSTADSIAETITMACDASMAKVRKGGNPQRPVAWWNEDIAKARRECHAARRQCQRHRSSPAYESLAQIYRLRRKIFKDTVKLSKARLFRELCEAADAQPFGAAYKMVMGRLARQPMPNCPTQLGRIISSLFPTQPPLDSTLHQPQQTEHGTRRNLVANVGPSTYAPQQHLHCSSNECTEPATTCVPAITGSYDNSSTAQLQHSSNSAATHQQHSTDATATQQQHSSHAATTQQIHSYNTAATQIQSQLQLFSNITATQQQHSSNSVATQQLHSSNIAATQKQHISYTAAIQLHQSSNIAATQQQHSSYTAAT
ncbi:hypothetical protein ACLKA7_001771 [Drosophila subpalustris]